MKSLKSIILLSLLGSVIIAPAKDKHEFAVSDSTPNYSIRRTSYFPTEAQIEKGCFLKNVNPLCTDGRRYIYVPDWNYASVYKFGFDGELEGSFDRKGQGPGEFQYVNSITAFLQGLVIIDSGNMKIAITDNDGKEIDAFRIFRAYSEVAVSNDGSVIYASSQSPQAKLIDVLDRDGRLTTSIGEKIDFKNNHSALNSIFLQRSFSGELWVAWKYFPIIRRYKSTGDLLGEYNIQDESLSEFVHKNQEVGNSVQTPRVTLTGIINGFFVSDGNFYVFLYGKDVKPRIAEYDSYGKLKATYEIIDSVEREIYVNFVMHKQNGEKTFYVLQGFPETRVDVFKVVNTSN